MIDDEFNDNLNSYRAFRMIEVYINMLRKGYSVSDVEIWTELQKIMKGGRTSARADAPAGVPTNADCKTS